LELELIDEEMNLQLLNAELLTKRSSLKRDAAAANSIPYQPRDYGHQHIYHTTSMTEQTYTKQVFIYEEDVDEDNL
jgi:hypothetical protein